jgi:hypothetical protein
MRERWDDFEVGDVWQDQLGTRTVLAVYDREVLVVWQPKSADRDTLLLPKRLFAEGKCGYCVEALPRAGREERNP